MNIIKDYIIKGINEHCIHAGRLLKRSLYGTVGTGIMMLALTSCSDIIDSITGGDIDEGDKVMFTTMVPDIPVSSRSALTEWKNKVSSYKAVQDEYSFKVSMFKEGSAEAEAEGVYVPTTTTDNDGNLTYHSDGTLTPQAGDMYWKDNVSRWGFKAESISSEEVEPDQSTQQLWLHQDKLVGYSYLPIWTGDDETGHGVDDFNKINYRTSKQWYADNKTAKDLSGLMADSNDDYKKIPLYMQHQRSWVTVILRAGEGVAREALAYESSADNILTTIYSYGEPGTAPLAITQSKTMEAFLDYDGDIASTTRYDAIVNPHNFIANHDTMEKDIIARISVSDQNFTFAAANDFNYKEFVTDGTGTSEATKKMQAYNLQPGKHLTIEATLSRGSRMIMITAWVEDWTETVTQTICDDYGKNGDPILINNRKELEDFLKGDNNKAGNVAMIVPDALPLTGGDWPSGYELKGTLNLAGATLSIDRPLFSSIAGSGNLVNGEILVDDAFNGASSVTDTNYGTIERVRITTSGENSPAQAGVAGLVQTNYGSIFQCTSSLPVYGTTGIVGGIAARNINPTNFVAAIDGCTVTARVDGGSGVTYGGGIVGEAEGRVSNNIFEYGITLMQDLTKFKNIIANIGEHGLNAHGNNAWPVTGNYTIGNDIEIVNNYQGQTYNAVIDNQDELKKLLTSGYNYSANIYRIAGSFSVNKDKDESNWIWGNAKLNNEYFTKDAAGNYARGNVKFKLNGNNKTITLTGSENATMLFGYVIGEIYDLNVVLEKPIVAARINDPDTEVDTNSDAISAVAYDVTGKLDNISLTTSTDAYIEASTPAGMAVWISENGTIINCKSNVPVKLSIQNVGKDARRYAGGIVACVHVGNVIQCKYYNGATTAISWNDNGKASNCNYGGIVGGTSEQPNQQDTPSLQIKDCSSWWTLPSIPSSETTRPTMGGIIGTTCYNTDMEVHNAMADGNSGNWWVGNVGAGKLAEGINEVNAIGRKNSVTPTNPSLRSGY